jgi:sugar lactone lactonase YvrE
VDGMTNLYVADSANNEIRKVTHLGTNWMVSTLAGRAGTFFSGDITNELFLTNVVSGETNIEGFTNVSFVLTNFSVITNFSGAITNVIGNVTNVFFLVTNVPVITNLTGVPPVVTNLTTNFFTLTTVVHSLDGPAAFALFSQPYAVAVDANTNVYVADRANNEIREISSAGLVSTLAGSALTNGTADGTGTNALFFHPSGIALDSAGNLYVTDTDNGTIREMTSAGTNWMVNTIAGLARFHGIADGTNNSARFDSPRRIAVDNSGTLYVSDGVDNTIRKIKPVGTNWVVTTVGGLAGVSGSSDGPGTNALFFEPEGLTVDSTGNLYIADTQNNILRFGQRTQAGQPMLQITRSGSQIIISWPMSAAGFTLQTSGNIFPGAPWSPVATNGMGTSGANFVVTNSIGAGNTFYRLLGP